MANLSSYVHSTLDNPLSGEDIKLLNARLISSLLSVRCEQNFTIVKGGGTNAENNAAFRAAYATAKELRNRIIGGYYIQDGDVYGNSFSKGDVISMYDYDNETSAYFVCNANLDDCQNDPAYDPTYWTLLPNGYDTSKVLSPNNRHRLILMPGTHTTSTFYHDQNYIDIVSMTGAMDVLFAGLQITASDTYIKGIDCGSYQFSIPSYANTLTVEKCKAGNYSFGGTVGCVVSGKFIDCISSDYSFGYGGTASGTFIRCTGGNQCFGGYYGTLATTASGIFTDCVAANYSFGGNSDSHFGTASGTFTQCISGNKSFGVSTASGTFYSCTGSMGTFAWLSGSVASGKFYNCMQEPILTEVDIRVV